jgi:hypothetical protein
MAKSRERLLAELRRRGARGGIIGVHRAMMKGRLTPWRLSSMLVIPILLSAVTFLLLPWLNNGWAWLLAGLRSPLGLSGDVSREAASVGGLSFAVPYLTTPAGLPGTFHFLLVGGFCAVAIAVSLVLPRRFLPLAYFLRFAVLLQLTAFLNFVLRPDDFPYELSRYLLSLFHIGSAVIVLIPLVLAFTYFPFDIAMWRKILLTGLCVGHITVLLPMQVMIHAYVVHHLSLLVMPTMFFLFGILPQLFVFIALYAWGMSWPDLPSRIVLLRAPAAPGAPVRSV